MQTQLQPEWPLSRFSSYIDTADVRFHVQQLGEGACILLLHGTGASTHSWRALALHLSSHYKVVMCDLPGHGYSSLPHTGLRLTLPAMSRWVSELLNKMGCRPDFLIGHSAGAAIACQMALDEHVEPYCIVSVNGALTPFTGVAGQLFSPLAHMMAYNTFIPGIISKRAASGSLTNRLLRDTGSVIDAEGQHYYKQLLGSKKHVAGALKMMADWNLNALAAKLPIMQLPLHLITGSNDKTVSPKQSRDLHQKLPLSTLHELEALGHLAHEENPKLLHSLIHKLLELYQITKQPAVAKTQELP